MVNEQKIIKIASLIASALSIEGSVEIPHVGNLQVSHNKHSTQKTMDGDLLMIPPSKSISLQQEKNS